MSDNNDQSTEQNEPDHIKDLRAKAKGTDAATARADAAERELAFVKAGVPTDTKVAQAFLSTYTGEMTPDAIKAEAKEWNLIPADETLQTSQFPEGSAERQQQEMREQLAGGGGAAGDEPPKQGGVDKALANFQKNREEGMALQQAQNHAFGEVIKAAAMGDKQAIFDPQEWEQKKRDAGHGAEFAR